MYFTAFNCVAKLPSSTMISVDPLSIAAFSSSLVRTSTLMIFVHFQQKKYN